MMGAPSTRVSMDGYLTRVSTNGAMEKKPIVNFEGVAMGSKFLVNEKKHYDPSLG